jgi:NTP pyrophosphatase (non-canonical NTP hydrolase)
MIDKDLKTIADYFQHKQVMKLVEEMAELTQAIAKLHNDDNEENSLHVIEEMADVEIVLEQLKYLLRSTAEFNIIKKQKIERTLQRIADCTYKK